jgi:hypothetical protein
LLQLGVGHRHVAIQPEGVNDVPAPAGDGEGNRQRAIALVAAVNRLGVAVAAGVQIRLDGARGVLEQVLVRRAFRAHGDEPLALCLGQRISREGDRDERSAIDGDGDTGCSVRRELHRVQGTRLVVAARAQAVLVALQLAGDRLGVVRLSLAHGRHGEEGVAIDLIELVEIDAADDRPGSRVDVEDERGAIGIVRLLEPRRDAGVRIASTGIDLAQCLRRFLRPGG